MTPDAIVIGGGHNGLVAACYLARGGLEVLLLEARSSVGGCTSTIEAAPGVRVNVCSCDHSMVRGSGIVEELDLAAHGLVYLEPDPIRLSAVEGQPPWWGYHEVDRTIDSIAKVLPAEAKAYARYVRDALPMAKLLRGLANAPLTARRGARAAAHAGGATARRVLSWGRSDPMSILRSYFASDALIAPALLTGPSVWGVAPDTPGTGLAALSYALGHLQRPGRPVGGSGALPAALASAFTGLGGTIRTSTPVDAVLYGGDEIRGVRLRSGEVIDAALVLCAVAPHQLAYAAVTGASRRANEWAGSWRDGRRPDGYEAKVDAVVSEAPRIRGVRYDEAGSESTALAASGVATPGAVGIAAAHDAYREGRVHDAPLLYFNVPSTLDAAMRPTDGGHLFSLEVLFTPYDLRGGWDTSREPERWLERFARFAEPGFLDSVRSYTVMTPPIYERDFFLECGHVPSFSGGPLAALIGRKHRSLSRHETPINGLYLSGGATFPGAGIWGASGRNAAAVALAAVGRP